MYACACLAGVSGMPGEVSRQLVGCWDNRSKSHLGLIWFLMEIISLKKIIIILPLTNLDARLCPWAARKALPGATEPHCLRTGCWLQQLSSLPTSCCTVLCFPPAQPCLGSKWTQEQSLASQGSRAPQQAVISSSTVSKPLRWKGGRLGWRVGPSWGPRLICRIGPDPETSQTEWQKALLFGHLLPEAKCAEKGDNEVVG